MSITLYDVLNIIFTLVVVGGFLWAYVTYLGDKGDKLKDIHKGICPRCKQSTIELKNRKGGGCSGTRMDEYICTNCGYNDSFNVDGGSCGSGGCRI